MRTILDVHRSSCILKRRLPHATLAIRCAGVYPACQLSTEWHFGTLKL